MVAQSNYTPFYSTGKTHISQLRINLKHGVLLSGFYYMVLRLLILSIVVH